MSENFLAKAAMSVVEGAMGKAGEYGMTTMFAAIGFNVDDDSEQLKNISNSLKLIFQRLKGFEWRG